MAKLRKDEAVVEEISSLQALLIKLSGSKGEGKYCIFTDAGSRMIQVKVIIK